MTLTGMLISRRLIPLSTSTARTSNVAALILGRRKLSNSVDQPASLVGRNFLTLKDYSQNEIQSLLWTALDLKTRIRKNKEIYRPLTGKSVAMIFMKRSTRTRMSTETGMSLLGGHACFLSPDDVHIGVNESIKDTARVLSRFNDAILARVFGQSDVDTLAQEASIPVISGLSDLYHPLQMLADLMTIQEHFGHVKGLKLAYVGDGNNIIHSILMGGIKMGLNIRIATPKGYECNKDVINDALNLSKDFNTSLTLTHDPVEAVDGTDIIVTDTWVSMGQEAEKARRLKDFTGYQVDKQMVKHAAPGWVFMHCLPRKAEEVTDEIFYSNNSLVWQEAENRMWTVMVGSGDLLKTGRDTDTVWSLSFLTLLSGRDATPSSGSHVCHTKTGVLKRQMAS